MNDTIKMFIGEEEVVSNKEFTINEEMLSASSTILNNCYPASWETDKNYSSRFYYPKDYSKFVLGKGNYQYGFNEFEKLEASDWSTLYTEVDYIEGTGTQYLDINYILTQDNSFEIKFAATQKANNRMVFGSRSGASSNNISITQGGTNIVVDFNNSDYNTYRLNYNNTLNTPYIIYNSKEKREIYDENGNLLAQKLVQCNDTITTPQNATLFYINPRPASNWYNVHGKIYYCKIYYHDILVKNLIPCYRNSDNIVGMYDTITGEFYTNIGTGNFTYGNIVNPESIKKYNTNTYKELADLNIYGKTEQETAPEVIGKNLLCFGTVSSAFQLQVSRVNNSEILINGTASQTGVLQLPLIYNSTLTNDTYTFLVLLSSPINNALNISLTPSINFTNISISAGEYVVQRSSSAENLKKPNLISIYVLQGTVFNNVSIKVQLEKGSTATQWEEFTRTPPMPSPERPSPLVSVGIPNNSKYDLFINNNGVKTIYQLDNPLGAVGDVKDYTFINGNGFCVMRNIGYINSYNGETITTSYNSTTGELTTGATIQYVLQNPIIEVINKNVPLSINGENNILIETGLYTVVNLYYYWKNYDVLFAGVVKNSGDISLRPTDPKYCSLQILDYKTFLSESDTLDFVINNKTIAQAIQMVIDAISGYGFILGNIDISQANDIIGAYSTLNKTAYDVFQYLANISGSRWRARFVDSDTMAIDFYDPELLPRANNIEYTQQYWEDNNIVDLTFNYGTRDYRNKQIILSDEVYGGIDYTEVLLSNGYDTSFITQNNVAVVKEIMVNGVAVQFITQSEKEMGVDADFYYNPGKNIIESTNTYTAGTQITVIYTPLVKGRQIVYNDEEVARIATQTNTTGVISRYESRNDILSSDELENIAETYIKYKGKPEIILNLSTLNNDILNVGEITRFDSPIAELAQDYMVKSKSITYITVGGETNIFYNYELTSSFNSEKAINYFDNQRNKAQGNIAEGESITRNIDINNSAMIIWENPTITEVSISVDGDNVLNSVLNSPFID